jgi:universal stress protein A
MLPYKHILVAIDFSPASDYVATYAGAIAKETKAHLSLVHVLEHLPLIYGGGEFAVPLDINLEETLEEHAMLALNKIDQSLGLSNTHLYVETGSIKAEIISLAEKIGADLIVVGRHSHRGLEKLLGSTANAILHAANCDVLAVQTKNS